MNWKCVYVGLLIQTISWFAAPCQRGIADEQLNILWIIGDDLGPELGCYGYEGVATPHLDKLAKEGTRYTKAFTNAPVCSSSRTSFATGMYQTSIGGHHHLTRLIKPLPEGVKPVSEYFREAGYFVCNGSTGGELLAGRGKVHYNFEHDPKTLFDGTDWRQRKEGQPFFAQAQIKEPHRAFIKSGRSGEGLKIPPFYPEHPVIRADWANYLASIEEMDRKVGLLIARLKEDGLYDNTVIFFFGDHGRPHMRGKQWLYDSGLHIPLIVRHPHWPAGEVKTALVSAIDFAPTCLAMAGITPPSHMQGQNWIDEKYKEPEFLFAARDRCGDAPDRIRSVRSKDWKYIRNFEPERSYSQLSSYKKMAYPAVTVMKVMHDQGRLSGRQGEWFADARPPEELYDLKADPWELINLANEPQQKARLQTMRTELKRWIKVTGDKGTETEGDAAYMEALLKSKRQYYERGMKKRGLNPEISDREFLEWWKKELAVE